VSFQYFRFGQFMARLMKALRGSTIFSSSPIRPWAYDEKSTKSVDNGSSSTSTVPATTDGKMVHGDYIKTHGLHWSIASLLVIGDMAGTVNGESELTPEHFL
jgi:hypothetical protein